MPCRERSARRHTHPETCAAARALSLAVLRTSSRRQLLACRSPDGLSRLCMARRVRPSTAQDGLRDSASRMRPVRTPAIVSLSVPLRTKPPQDYPHRLLVTVTGLSPQIVTETVYALVVAHQPPFVPTEIRLLTTVEGAERAKLSLLHPESGWFHRLREGYALPGIAFGPEYIHVLRDADDRPLDDIRTPEDNTRAADAITDLIRKWTTGSSPRPSRSCTRT